MKVTRVSRTAIRTIVKAVILLYLYILLSTLFTVLFTITVYIHACRCSTLYSLCMVFHHCSVCILWLCLYLACLTQYSRAPPTHGCTHQSSGVLYHGPEEEAASNPFREQLVLVILGNNGKPGLWGGFLTGRSIYDSRCSVQVRPL